MWAAINQRHPGALLKGLNTATERSLAQVYPRGGRCKAPLFRKGDEMGETAQVHGEVSYCVKCNITPLYLQLTQYGSGSRLAVS